MRTCFLLLLFLCASITGWALHGKGGMLTYEYLGVGAAPNTTKYRITGTHYIDCGGTQFTETAIFVGIFDGAGNKLLRTLTIQKSGQDSIYKKSFGCINPAPNVCFVVATYVQEVELANNAAGYLLVEQECCRIVGIQNLVASNSYGSTFTATVPGGANRRNSSPQFAARDTAVICYSSFFRLDMSATDADGDSLSYAFCSALTGGSGSQRQPNPPADPPYNEVGYSAGYSGAIPLGTSVTINPRTGMISGTAPAVTGKYIVSVCVSEYRNGMLIATTKKEVQVEVANCKLSAAVLQPEYINCNSFTSTFENENPNAEVATYSWDFGVSGINTDVSTAQRPSYTYPDTGRYVVKLKVSTTNGCTDSTTTEVAVYPGFAAGFSIDGSCYQSPFVFTDTTKATYGVVNKWKWNIFPVTNSTDQNITHQFSGVGQYPVSMIVSSSKGCIDTIETTVNVYDRPDLKLGFKDTLICSIDTLQLRASGAGTYQWTATNGSGRILDAATATPRVFPQDTTFYKVTLTEKTCVATDTVRVAVLPFITVQLPADTSICRGDSIQLLPQSRALQYQWTPATGMDNATARNPMVAPNVTTSYRVTANLGRCQDEATMVVKVAPYPQAFAGRDTLICYDTDVRLQGDMVASAFRWNPSSTLTPANSLLPLARPLQPTAYVLTVSDTLGCPKEVSDTVLVGVVPRIFADAGRDTAVVAGQPLQLQASGGDAYQWSPLFGLNNPDIANPVALLDRETETITYRVSVERDGCYATDSIKVVVYKLGADILVPSAFSPNGDGRNDVLKPILVGMKSLTEFQVYNRWGQLVYSTRTAGQGWDGRIGGSAQGSGVYVFLATGTTFDDRKIVRKGTVMLVR
ncbi:PKD domain-containing protein [Paracnuella aquatica]|uniref:PKD domain-containing protein n=1 Tax=Paracnuella aquatica TaxID=2268757 RepID=UPI000DEFC120|nr:PKD domain-containing protein [Paracnuella aquatica]RPD50687.1 PKD domain-containing protein [Paracnuella aquatica]